MTQKLLAEVTRRFNEFTAPYLAAQGDAYAYRLKVEHTTCVEGIAHELALAEGLPDRLVLAARLAGLMHDVGRFPQYRTYRTFRDADSANHALLSVRHTLRENLLEGVPPDMRKLVLGAVFLHNKRQLPRIASPELDTLARILRDSDKLDIYRIMLGYFEEETPSHPEVALDVIIHPSAYSPAVLEDLYKREPGDYRNVVYLNDFKLMLVGWMYDINSPTALALLRQRGYIEALFAGIQMDRRLLDFRDHVLRELALLPGDA